MVGRRSHTCTRTAGRCNGLWCSSLGFSSLCRAPGTRAGGEGPQERRSFALGLARNCPEACRRINAVLSSCMEFVLTLPEARLEMRSEIRLLECLEQAGSAVEASAHAASLRFASSCRFEVRSCLRCSAFSRGRRWRSPSEMLSRQHRIRSGDLRAKSTDERRGR